MDKIKTALARLVIKTYNEIAIHLIVGVFVTSDKNIIAHATRYGYFVCPHVIPRIVLCLAAYCGSMVK